MVSELSKRLAELSLEGRHMWMSEDDAGHVIVSEDDGITWTRVAEVNETQESTTLKENHEHANGDE